MAEFNELTNDKFVDKFKNLIELCPWVAKSLAFSRPFESAEEFFQEACDLLDSLPWNGKPKIRQMPLNMRSPCHNFSEVYSFGVPSGPGGKDGSLCGSHG